VQLNKHDFFYHEFKVPKKANLGLKVLSSEIGVVESGSDRYWAPRVSAVSTHPIVRESHLKIMRKLIQLLVIMKLVASSTYSSTFHLFF